jgi:Flp pilus assembly protein TadG
MRGLRRDERGQVIIIFAILLPMFMGLGALVLAGGSWFAHAKHLQTKADAGALAGGQSWAFPCGPQIDARIAADAQQYAGSRNPQIGNVGDSSIHTVLNGPAFYDDDSNPNPVENLAICNTMRLDVKVTEDNSFPLFSLLPMYPDIKRKAVVELQEGETFGGPGLIPIGMRAPVPLSAAVFYNETNGQIFQVRYFVRNDAILGLPAALQGWTTLNTENTGAWANFTPAARTGVLIAQSFRGACNTNLPNPNTKIPVAAGGPCFEDEYVTVSTLCNQGSIPLVNCYYATGSHPNQAAQAGLHFIRGYANLNPGNDAPAVESAWLDNVSCISNGYFNWQRAPTTGSDCQARLQVRVDVGTLEKDLGPPGPVGDVPLPANDVEVRFRLVRGNGSTQCNYNANCDLQGSGSGPNITFATQGNGGSPHLILQNNSTTNAVAIQVKLRNAVNSSDPDCRGSSFTDQCRWFYTGNGNFGPSTPPSNNDILGAPVQRSFRGNSVDHAGPIQWLRLTTDSNCDGGANFIDGEAASHSGPGCFVMDMGLRGGLAQDADEPSLMLDDGTGPSQTGTIHCPGYNQGQSITEGIPQGCITHTTHPFNYTPLCPPATGNGDIFSVLANPVPPWLAWPPPTCVKTRPQGNPNDIGRGFSMRFYGTANINQANCPPDGPGFVRGRNYWNTSYNPANNGLYGYKDNDPARGPVPRDTFFHPADPRLVTIFLVPASGFTNSGQDTYPIAGFVQLYVEGYGPVQNNGNVSNDDPCPGGAVPPPSEAFCQGNSCGYIVWGHLINWVVTGAGGRPSPTGSLCNPGGSLSPCIPVLVE